MYQIKTMNVMMWMFQDFDGFQIHTDLAAMKSWRQSVSDHLLNQMDDIAELNQEIEESKKRLLEIQFNATIASLMFNV